MRAEKGALQQNLAETLRYLDLAAQSGADLVALPEASLTGYVEPARYPEAVVDLGHPALLSLVAATAGSKMTLLVGLIERHPLGCPPYVTQVVLCDGAIAGCYRKRRIVDDEAGWFTPGRHSPVFWHDDLCFGIAICADIGDRAPFHDAAAQGAQLVVEVAAPGLYGDQVSRNWRSGWSWWRGECDRHLSRYARELGIWIAVATQAGRTVDEDFPGGGYLYDPEGRCVGATDDWSEGMLIVDVPV